jgi:CheY-like chemotaxis protein
MRAVTGLAQDRRCLAGLRVLVVDDDEDVRDSLLAILLFFGADGCAVEGAEDARALLASCDFDALLSDIEMPDEDGYDLIRSVRRARRTARIPAAAVTARASSEDCRVAIAAGFDRVVGKPLDIMTLVDAVLELVGRA